MDINSDFVHYDNESMMEMPMYKCHKIVWALKIKSIVRDGEGEDRETDGSAIITPEEEGYAPFRVEHDYMHKHRPHVGGYCVVYEDGYKSFSPADAFEKGYSKLELSQIKESFVDVRNDSELKRLALEYASRVSDTHTIIDIAESIYRFLKH